MCCMSSDDINTRGLRKFLRNHHHLVHFMSAQISWDAITALSTASSAIIILVTGIFIFLQLRETKRATIATAFSSIVSILQDDKVRKARGTLIRIYEENFTKWTDEQRNKAELACSRFDAVGIMIRKNVIDHRMVTHEWRNSIKECWEHAQPMITSYRESRGKDFWDDFEWLYKKGQ